MTTTEITPAWVQWNYLALYQRDGMEWQSPELKEIQLVTKARKLLRKIKEKSK